MVDEWVIASKLSDLRSRVERVRQHCPPDAQTLAADQDAHDLVAFNLLLSVQAAIDAAGHIVADEGWSPAPVVAENFSRLAEHGVLTEETAAALAKAVGLRNVVAHGYATTDVTLLHKAATEGLTDLEDFARQMSRWTTNHTHP